MAESEGRKPRPMAETAVNMRGLKCPLPALKTRKLLSKMAAGELLVIECTDPLTAIDIPNLIRETGDTIEGSGKKGRVLTFRIRKSLTLRSFLSYLPTSPRFRAPASSVAVSASMNLLKFLDAHRIGDQAIAGAAALAPPALHRAVDLGVHLVGDVLRQFGRAGDREPQWWRPCRSRAP